MTGSFCRRSFFFLIFCPVKDDHLLPLGQADKIFAKTIEPNRKALVFLRMNHGILQSFPLQYGNPHMKSSHLEIGTHQCA